ncbi:MAG: sigma-70 family RNA polymerase sigma factor [Prevotella sp.]|nr:sigma-70 family RNA polymerase sigma factor [Prevotella sp.]
MNKEISKEDFARLVQQYASQVLDFTTRLLSDRREAEEVAQDAFVKAFRSLDTFNFQSSFCTWVCRIAYHMSLDRLKRQHPYYVDIDNLPAIADEELSTGREERIALMEEAIDDLTNDEQLLIHLYYYEDRPLRDIAYIMDVEPNALATRLHRIRKKLSRMIKQKEHGQADR